MRDKKLLLFKNKRTAFCFAGSSTRLRGSPLSEGAKGDIAPNNRTAEGLAAARSRSAFPHRVALLFITLASLRYVVPYNIRVVEGADPYRQNCNINQTRRGGVHIRPFLFGSI